jgi:hypothetical protein
VQEEIRQILSVQKEEFEEKYLGLPTPDGRMGKGKFANLQELLAKCILLWGDLSQGGKEVMIKAIAQALPLYIMGVFKLPMSVCDDLMKLIRDFWWGTERGKRKTHWISWDIMMRSKPHGGMGFRDMRLFNQALLARQAWRLITRPDSLCARVLRAKYYPQGNLIDTVFTGKPSPTWCAIVYGLELLKQGLIWRIGNGESVRIWRDNWIPRETFLKPFSVKGRSRLIRVASLLDENNQWDEALVRRTFQPIDAICILRIKTSARKPEDFVAWQHESNGCFSVRSAYRLGLRLVERDRPAAASSSAPLGDRPIWKKLWKLNVPEKVRIFAWKVLSNGLATEENKRRRHIPVDGSCQICGQGRECSFHALISCPHAAALWATMTEVWPNVQVPGFNGRDDWFEVWLESMDSSVCCRILMIAWRVWYSRNEVTHDKPLPSVEGSRRFIRSYMVSLENVRVMTTEQIIKGKQVVGNEPVLTVPIHPKPAHAVWVAPPVGCLKLNIDGAFVAQTGAAGAGMVLRRSDGTIVLAACRELRLCSSAFEAELLACLEGVQLALNYSVEQVLVESDCLELVKVANEQLRCGSSCGHLVEDLRLRLSDVRFLSFIKIPRTCNAIGHELAKIGMVESRTQVWLGSVPESLKDQTEKDCNSISIN